MTQYATGESVIVDGAEAVDIALLDLTRIEVTRKRSAELFALFGDVDVPQGARTTARDELVHLHLPLVQHCARRFRNRGEPHDDLVQVGTIGLIKAVDRFETHRGLEFSTYATPTIIGEIKRYFRDKGWAIRVPRRLQELHMQITATTGMSVYFCEPRSPWQWGTNENSNGLLRGYFPKATNLAVQSAERLAQVQDELNNRPRKALGWRSPAAALAQLQSKCS